MKYLIILLGILGSFAGLDDLGGADGGWAGFVGAIVTCHLYLGSPLILNLNVGADWNFDMTSTSPTVY